MRQVSSVLLVICLVLPLGVWASPTPFESAGADVREYIVLSLASHIRANSTIGLFLSRGDDDVKDGVIPWYYTFELGQERSRCLEILKGDVSIADYTFCFFYCTPRENLEVFLVRSGCVGGWEYVRSYRWKGETYPCRGKEVWQFEPPYDPFRSDWNDEYVRLMFLTPERKLDISRIKLLKPSKVYEGETIASKVKGDVRKMPPEEVMRQLGVEGVFSNRVFRLNEGGVFQVDYDVPQLKGRVLDETARKCLDAARKGSANLVHLSAAEVSEVVYLAYAADGDRDGAAYAAAVRRCPGILRPFAPPFRTELGRRVDAALRDGTRLPEAKPLREDR